MSTAEKIRKLAEDKDALILAHNYQSPEIQDLADITGDSLELARKAKAADERTLIVCGVYFMAETAKILSPEKTVLIPNMNAGCPLADQLSAEIVKKAKSEHNNAPFVVYVNSNAETKAACDITCTSANSAEVVRSLPEKTILFGPDANLAAWTQCQVPEKNIICVPENGGCPVHHSITMKDVEKIKEKHPSASVIAHPECPVDVQKTSDIVGSTGYMMKNLGESKEWAVLTEKGIAHPLQKKYPDKIFHVIDDAVCPGMKIITEDDLYNSLLENKFKVEIPQVIADRARFAIERMISVSK